MSAPGVPASRPSPPESRRPHVICHMMATVDGRIVTGRWPDLGEGWGEYERTGATFGADAWMCGRITMEAMAGGVRDALEVPREAASRAGGAARPDFVAPGARPSYAVALDPSGRLLWEASDIGGDHIVAVLGERVSDDYLARLRERGVSYLLVGGRGGEDADRGGDDIDLAAALDGAFGAPSLFDIHGGDVAPRRLALEAVERGANDVLWLRCRVERTNP